MDSTFINTMIDNLDVLENAFTTFSSDTFTEDIWFGIASDNAKNLINEKIVEKITNVREKLSSLEQAMAYANECDSYKEEIDSIKSSINSLDQNSENYQSTFQSYSNTLNSYQSSYDSALNNLKGLNI